MYTEKGEKLEYLEIVAFLLYTTLFCKGKDHLRGAQMVL